MDGLLNDSVCQVLTGVTVTQIDEPFIGIMSWIDLSNPTMTHFLNLCRPLEYQARQKPHIELDQCKTLHHHYHPCQHSHLFHSH